MRMHKKFCRYDELFESIALHFAYPFSSKVSFRENFAMFSTRIEHEATIRNLSSFSIHFLCELFILPPVKPNSIHMHDA